MKTGKEWEAWYWDQDFETGEGVMARFAEAVQADALEESARTAIDATHAGPRLESEAWSVALATARRIVEAIRALKPAAPASPEKP